MKNTLHSYDILANPKYHETMQYFASTTFDRVSYMVGNTNTHNHTFQSDVVRICLNLGCLTPDQIKGLKLFDCDSIKNDHVLKVHYEEPKANWFN